MKAWKHFCTITKHRHLVMKHCFKCGIPLQGLKHDLSKYSPTEFREGARYYTGTRSPNEGERRKKGYSEAWMHHKGRNRHHFEYWNDFCSETKRYEPVPMPEKYLAEMVCDRMAASKVYKGKEYTDESPLLYFLNGYGRYQMHPDTAKKLEYILTLLKEQGEKATFSYVKKMVKESKKGGKKR